MYRLKTLQTASFVEVSVKERRENQVRVAGEQIVEEHEKPIMWLPCLGDYHLYVFFSE